MEKPSNLKLLQLPDRDFILERLQTVEQYLIDYTDCNENREAERCLDNLQQAISWYSSAFDVGNQSQPQEEIESL
jgi:hypothetical protein